MESGNSFGGRRVLVVEDDFLAVADLVDRLQSMGADVVGPVPNVERALEQLDRQPAIRGAILDLNVQGKMVFSLADELSRRDVPYVFSTGYEASDIPSRYAHIPRFPKPADDRTVAAALLGLVIR